MKLPPPIKSYIHAYNRKDVPAMLGCLADTVRFRNIADGSVTADTRDKAGFQALAEVGLQMFSRRRQRVLHALTVADTTIAEIEFSAVVAQDLPNGWQAGQAVQFKGASLFRLERDRIQCIIDQS